MGDAMTRDSEVPVLIVGAGAAGLSTAAVLAQQGVKSWVVERRAAVYRYPKARNLSFRSLEILRRLGLRDAVHAVADDVSDMVVKPSLSSAVEAPALDLDSIFGGLADLSPEPPAQYCPQSRLEPMLADYVRGRGNDVSYSTELLSFSQDATGVRAQLRDRQSGLISDVRARYLIAADGVHSPIRKSLAVSTSGHGALPIYVIFVYFKSPRRQLLSHLREGSAVQIVNADVNGIIVPADDDLAIFVTTYFPEHGDTAATFTEQHCRDLLLAAIGQPMDIDIVDITPWQPHELVADRFRCGSVFFVGDSAHAMPPFKAGGANVAIQSADNLAWKLAAVLNGTAGDGLLDTYHAERRPVGVFSAHQSLTGPSIRLLNLPAEPDMPPIDERSMFALLIGYRYASAAVIGDTAPADDDIHLIDKLRAQPGTRLPHAWVVDHDERVSTLDLLGVGFTLLTGTDDAVWRAAVRGAPAPITLRSIGPHDAVDPDGRWNAMTGLSSTGALLVRPDAFVAARFDTVPPDPRQAVYRALAAVLGTRRPAQCHGHG
jgi:2-polyprenyl-6-methoxyphenol hydroxylase-like FAD-dependent oxidoreductase